MKSKQKKLKRDGKGNKQFEAAPLIQDEMEMLYNNGAFSCNNPQALINTFCYNYCLHFGSRGGKEQSDLKWEDVVLKKKHERLSTNTKSQESIPQREPRECRSARSEMVQTSTNGGKQVKFPHERLCTTGGN